MVKTYKELLEYLNTLTKEELDLDITEFDTDWGEIYKVDLEFKKVEERYGDILEEGHPYYIRTYL